MDAVSFLRVLECIQRDVSDLYPKPESRITVGTPDEKGYPVLYIDAVWFDIQFRCEVKSRFVYSGNDQYPICLEVHSPTLNRYVVTGAFVSTATAAYTWNKVSAIYFAGFMAGLDQYRQYKGAER